METNNDNLSSLKLYTNKLCTVAGLLNLYVVRRIDHNYPDVNRLTSETAKVKQIISNIENEIVKLRDI